MHIHGLLRLLSRASSDAVMAHKGSTTKTSKKGHVYACKCLYICVAESKMQWKGKQED